VAQIKRRTVEVPENDARMRVPIPGEIALHPDGELLGVGAEGDLDDAEDIAGVANMRKPVERGMRHLRSSGP